MASSIVVPVANIEDNPLIIAALQAAKNDINSISVGAVTLASLATLLAAAPTTLPGSPGVVWLNGGVVQIS